jgi:hypothetical protein
MREVTRRDCLTAAAALAFGAAATRRASAFGEAGAFNPRLLVAGNRRPLGQRESGASRWSWELVRRTSAPARLVVGKVSADRSELWSEPFAVWAGEADMGALALSELSGLERFFRLGGVLLVDDSAPESGAFGRAARREIARVLPESPPVRLDPTHVLFKSYYLLERPFGRVIGSGHVDAIVRGRSAQVVFLDVDLLGALSRSGEGWSLETSPGGGEQRERAVRLAVNIAMYVLCSDYKDDQVHAEWLMRRRRAQSR